MGPDWKAKIQAQTLSLRKIILVQCTGQNIEVHVVNQTVAPGV